MTLRIIIADDHPVVRIGTKAVIDGGDAPDLVLFPQNYEGRDVVSRLSVKLDRTVLTNNVDVEINGDYRS